MNKVLIICDGILAKNFLDKVAQNASGENFYHIIYKNEYYLPDSKPQNSRFYKIDATSIQKLSFVVKENFAQAMIIMPTKSETEFVLENLQKLGYTNSIAFIDKWDIQIPDAFTKQIKAINVNGILANRLYDRLPNVQIVAHNVGLGQGEIMEVRVPFGSSFVYRHLSSIEQKNFKIVAVYRNATQIIATPRLVIMPNDILLVIGNPDVLKNLFKAIKNIIGQYPAPFGENIVVFVDSKNQSLDAIVKLLDEAIYFHRFAKNNTLFIRVINATTREKIELIKSYSHEDVIVEFDYQSTTLSETFDRDFEQKSIGTIIVGSTIFYKKEHLEYLYNLNIPILSIGKHSTLALSEIAVIVEKNVKIEQISSVVFEISSLFSQEITLINHTPDGEDRGEIVENFTNMSKIFNRQIKLKNGTNNPIKETKNIKNFIQILPFGQNILETMSWKRYFQTNTLLLSCELKGHTQLFVPVK